MAVQQITVGTVGAGTIDNPQRPNLPAGTVAHRVLSQQGTQWTVLVADTPEELNAPRAALPYVGHTGDPSYRTLMLLPAPYADAANGMAVGLTGNRADAETFTDGLSPTGQAPPTHFIASCAFAPEARAQVAGMAAMLPGTQLADYVVETDHGETEATLLQQLGLQRITTAKG